MGGGNAEDKPRRYTFPTKCSTGNHALTTQNEGWMTCLGRCSYGNPRDKEETLDTSLRILLLWGLVVEGGSRGRKPSLFQKYYLYVHRQFGLGSPERGR